MKRHLILSEALRLFFALAAAHGALWPFLWVIVDNYDLPFARDIPVSQWHAHEMVFGCYCMALAGFLASAVPEWTDTKTAQGRTLIGLAALWVPARLIGLFGIDALSLVAGLSDLAFLGGLTILIARAMLERRTAKHVAFLFWLLTFVAIEAGIRWTWHVGDFETSARLLQSALCVFVILVSLSTVRINVVVINLALDPTGETTPYRPHPGRRHMAAAMVTIYMATSLIFPQSQVSAWLALAGGAAFLDRLTEWFIGKAVFKTEVLMLGLANLFAALGFLLLGATQLGLSVAPAAALHLIAVGSLGCAVIAVFIIAGLRHTGRDLQHLPWQAHAAAALMVAAALIRIIPEFEFALAFAPAHHALSALLWAASFGVWLTGFLPFLAAESVASNGSCN